MLVKQKVNSQRCCKHVGVLRFELISANKYFLSICDNCSKYFFPN